jgi:hypothetical protein
MPRATVSVEPVTCKLKSLPDGSVTIKKMSYGDTLARSDLQMSAPMQNANGGNPEITFQTSPKDTVLFDFRKCLIDHNLEDESGTKLDLTSPQGLDKLDPAVGTEVAELIDKLNSGEDMSPFLS